LSGLLRNDSGDVAALADLTNSELELAGVQRRLGRLQDAAATLNSSREHCLQAVQLRPETRNRHTLAAVEHNRGELLQRTRELPAAEQAFRRSAELLAELVRDDPDNHSHERDRASSLYQLGRVLNDRGNTAQAERTLDEAIATWRDLLRKSPTSSDYRYGLGAVLAYTGRGAEASQVAEELAKLPGELGANLYSAACVFALSAADRQTSADRLNVSRASERAMRLLEQAVDAGFNSRLTVEDDTDLDALRSRDDYKKLLERLK
jgi:tetratricopeptide (TPR) repeat protein